VNAYASHALGHFRDAFWPEQRALPGRVVMLENLGLPTCPVCFANFLRRAWLLDPKDARA
jgi:hypothetical protein